MIVDHCRIHAPLEQRGRHVHQGRPACYTHIRETKGQEWEGWHAGALPGLRNPFALHGVLCGCAMERDTWFSLLSSTPGCMGCARGRPEPLA